MTKFNYTPDGFNKAMEWAKSVHYENGKTLYEHVSKLPSSEDKLYFVNMYYGKSI